MRFSFRWPRRPAPRNLYWLTPTLAVGGVDAARQARALAKLGVRAVVDLQQETADQRDRLQLEGLISLKVPVQDFGAPQAEQLEQTADWVLRQMQELGPVFIHCRAGLGRSATFAIAVLMRMGYGLAEAYALVRRERPEIAVSEPQLEALRRFATQSDP